MESASNAATPGSSDLDHSSIRVAHPPRFDLSNSESKVDFLNYLDEHGYAVVAAAADEAEVAAAKARFWSAAQLNADDVLDPDAPECETRWWLNKQTGSRIPCHLAHRAPPQSLVLAQASPVDLLSIIATSAGKLGCFPASTTLSPQCATHFFI
jgi:hypothetical protein